MTAPPTNVGACGLPILLVEDDEPFAGEILSSLAHAGLDATWIREGARARILPPDDYALWIVALELPGCYGLDVLRDVRANSDVPVMILGNAADARLRVRALELGGDDYLARPVNVNELVARARARLRRPHAVDDDGLRIGELRLDLRGRRLWRGPTPVELTRVEFDLLATLARRGGVVLERTTLAEEVLDPHREGTGRTLDVHVSRLRRKLEDHASCIETVRGIGYRFDSASLGRTRPRRA